MEKINLSEAIEKLAIAYGIAREEIEAVLEYYQAQQPQDVPKFDIDDYCNRYNIEYYIDPDIREETREQHKLHLHHSSKRSQAATPNPYNSEESQNKGAQAHEMTSDEEIPSNETKTQQEAVK